MAAHYREFYTPCSQDMSSISDTFAAIGNLSLTPHVALLYDPVAKLQRLAFADAAARSSYVVSSGLGTSRHRRRASREVLITASARAFLYPHSLFNLATCTPHAKSSSRMIDSSLQASTSTFSSFESTLKNPFLCLLTTTLIEI
jgi:hypothetical protein